MTNQIAELTSSGSSRSWSGSEQKCHQTGACVPIVTAASAGCYFSQLWSGASSSDLHHAGPVTPGGSNHVPLSGADLIELSNFTGRDWAHGQGLSVARAPCQGRFRRGTWSWLHAPRKRWSGPCGLLARPPWSVMLAFGPCAWAPGGALGRKSDGNRDFPGGGCPRPHRVAEVRGQVGFLGQDCPTILAFSPQS